MRTTNRLGLLLLLVLLFGCGTPDRVPRFVPALEPFDPADPDWIKTRKVLLVADCQIHNLLSKSLPERNLSAKAMAATAIRSPQLDLFSGDVMKGILTHSAGDATEVIHLGDALDLATKGEFRDFVDVMESGGKPWVMAPGNHDFFYLGVYDPEQPDVWEDAAYMSEGPLKKDVFIGAYVAALIRQRGPGYDDLAAALGLTEVRDGDLFEVGAKVPESFEWHMPEGTKSFFRGIAWNMNREEHYRSFITQRVDLSGDTEVIRGEAILLDSNQYALQPAVVPNAWKSWPFRLNVGLTGEMLGDQLRLVRRWTDKAVENDQFVFYMSHHPVSTFAGKTLNSIRWLWSRNPISLFVTAHTHHGYYEHHFFEDDGSDDFFNEEGLELNIGSTTDWPMEWRSFQAFAKGPTEVYAKVERFTVLNELENSEGFFLRGWEIPPGAPDDYRKFVTGEPAVGILIDTYLFHHIAPPFLGQPVVKASKPAQDTEAQVKDTLLWTYERLIRMFPTDPTTPGIAWPDGAGSDADVTEQIGDRLMQDVTLEEKIALLAQLKDFEKSRKTVDPKTGESTEMGRWRYKVSQAVWASRFEHAGGRMLQVEDELIRINPRKPRKKPEEE